MLYENLPVNRFRNKMLDQLFWLASRLSGVLASTYSKSRGLFSKYGIPYKTDFGYRNTLDIIFPSIKSEVPHPVAIHIHGGGFRIFSKDSHSVVAAMLADMGYIVFNINYRLAPAYPFPAAVEDVIDAYNWVTCEAENYIRTSPDIPDPYRNIRMDFSNFMMMGESAGANLVLSLTLALLGHGDKSLVSRLKSKQIPSLIVPMCGFLEPTTVDKRFGVNTKISPWVFDRMKIIQKAYVPDSIESGHKSDKHALASPLYYLKSMTEFKNKFPEVIFGVGTNDPVQNDSYELDETLKKLKLDSKLWIFENEPHGFHIFFWRKKSREFWKKFRVELSEHQKRAKKNPSLQPEFLSASAGQ